jgi:lysophospholipase L1-like esterase
MSPARRRPWAPRRERALKYATVVLALLALLGVAEAGLRLLAYWTPYIAKVSEYEAGHHYLGKALIPGAVYSTRTGRIQVNSRGFRGKEFDVPKPAGVYRIFALGGSTTFGYYPAITSDADTYPARLESLLNENKPDPAVSRYEAINAGVPGYSVRTSIQNFAARIVFFQPDMILVYHNVNDLARYGSEHNLLYPLQNQYIPTGFLTGLLDHMLGWSYAVQELRFTLTERVRLGAATAAAQSPTSQGGWTPDPRYPDAFRRDLRNLVILAKANGVTPVLMSEAVAITEKTDYANLTDDERKMQLHKSAIYLDRIPPRERHRMLKLYNNIIREVAEQERVPFVDVDAAIPKTSEYHWDYCHLTNRGAALQAEVIAKALRQVWGPRVKH